MKLLPMLLAASLTTPAFATLNVSQVVSEDVKKLEINADLNPELRGHDPELCFIPKHLPGGKYSKGDLKNEQELCDMNIGVNMAACGKTESSNPGVNFYSPSLAKGEKRPAADIWKTMVVDLQKKLCKLKVDSEISDKDAKYKLSTSCSYAPSIISYYHMSRALGNIVNVPTSVLRTMDYDRHLGIAVMTEEFTKEGELIDQTFDGFLKQLKEAKSSSSSKARPLLLTDDLKQTYGALSENPKKEGKYTPEFFNGGADEARVVAFKEKNSIYKELGSAEMKVPRQFTQANVQRMVQLRDAADFIVLDTILGQKDRFGNIHYFTKYFYTTKNEKGEFDVESEKKKDKVPAGATVVEVKEMLLKDNDCGVAKENLILKHALWEGIAHISPKTYNHLINFAKVIDDSEVKEQFILGYKYTEDDFKKVSGNLKMLAGKLKERCLSGRLKLDLSLDDHFSGLSPKSHSCEPIQK